MDPSDAKIVTERIHAANGHRSLSKKALEFIKEWGGVATVLIAILYTFPFDAAGKIINWRDQSLLDVRKTLSEVAALYAAETSAVAAVQDQQTKFFLANTYAIRIYNLLSENEAAILAARSRLLPSELYFIGSLYVLSGLPDAMTYYKSALEKSTSDAEKEAIYREIGNGLFSAGPNQNITDARAAYVQPLTISSKTPYLFVKYTFDLTELGNFELMNGDWKCGQQVTNYRISLFDAETASNPAAAEASTQFRNVVAAMTRKPGQSAKGCPYQLPLLPKTGLPVVSSQPITVPEPSNVPQSATSALSPKH